MKSNMNRLLSAFVTVSSIIRVAFPDFCNFQSECSEWTSEKYWTRVRFGMFNNKQINAPKTDHTLNKSVGFYLYLNSTDPQNKSNIAKLLSNSLKHPNTCLTFWYFMYQNDAQSLTVFRVNSDSTMTELWNKTDSSLNEWIEAKIQFSYDREFRLIFEGSKTSAGHMALDDISISPICPETSNGRQSTTDDRTFIGKKNSKEKQLSYGVYVGIVTGLAAILLIASIVTLIIIRKRRHQASQRIHSSLGRDLENAKKHGDRHEDEKASISNERPNGNFTEHNESHINVHTTPNYPCAVMTDIQSGQVSSTGHENNHNLPYIRPSITYDYVDGVYNTTNESSHQMPDNTYDNMSSQDEHYDSSKASMKGIIVPTYDHVSSGDEYDDTSKVPMKGIIGSTYDHVSSRDEYNDTSKTSMKGIVDSTYEYVSSRDEYDDTSKVTMKEIVYPTYDHTAEEGTHIETQVVTGPKYGHRTKPNAQD